MRNLKIVLQQDNATPHKLVTTHNEQIILKCAELGLTVEIRNQPPNSPDLNILDLGLFRALQSCYFKDIAGCKLVLIEKVTKALADYNYSKINNVFLTLMGCMNEIIKENGGNNYSIPCMSKTALERTGDLLQSIAVTLHPNALEDDPELSDNDDDLFNEEDDEDYSDAHESDESDTDMDNDNDNDNVSDDVDDGNTDGSAVGKSDSLSY